MSTQSPRLIEFLDLTADPDRPACVDLRGEVHTRGQLLARATSSADRLEQTVPRGRRVGLSESRSVDDLVGLLGSLIAGRPVAMLPAIGASSEAARLASESRCGVVLDSTECSRVTPDTRDDPALHPSWGAEESGSAEVVVLYTSGTTSRPRGVRLTERNVLTNLTAMSRIAARWTPNDRFGMVLSISHSFGLSMALLALARQVPIVLLDNGPPSRRLVENMDELGISVFASVPYFLRLLARRGVQLGATSLPRLREVYLAGGGIAEDQLTLLGDFHGDLYLMYGLTECTARVALRRYGDGAPSGSVGLPLPGTHVDVVDEAGKPQPVGTEGLIRVTSPSVMLGYLGQPPRHPSEPFVTTDLGVLDSAGHLRITGRQAEMLNFRGNRVSLLAVEAGIQELPGVVDVLLRPQSTREDAQCVALIVGAPLIDQAAVRRDIIRTVVPRGVISEIQFVESVPRTRSGKPTRH